MEEATRLLEHRRARALRNAVASDGEEARGRARGADLRRDALAGGEVAGEGGREVDGRDGEGGRAIAAAAAAAAGGQARCQVRGCTLARGFGRRLVEGWRSVGRVLDRGCHGSCRYSKRCVGFPGRGNAPRMGGKGKWRVPLCLSWLVSGGLLGRLFLSSWNSDEALESGCFECKAW